MNRAVADSRHINIAFGRLLKSRRTDKDLSQTQLADALGLSRISIANFESGGQRVALKYIVPLTKVLEFSFDKFCRDYEGLK